MDDHTVNIQGKGKSIALVIALLIFLGGIISFNKKNITLKYEDKVMDLTSYKKTVGEFLDEQDIQLKKKGYVNHPLEEKLVDDMFIVVKDPKTYTIEVGKDIRTNQVSAFEKVEDVLRDLDIKVEKKDYTEPALDKKVKDGDTIKLYKVTEVMETVEKEIPFEKVFQDNKNMDLGETKIIQEGANGVKLEEVKSTYVNGELKKTELVKEKITKNPVTQLAEKGSRPIAVVSRGSGSFNSRRNMVMNATAYDLSFASTGKRPGDRGYGITASGTRARRGAVAVDPRVIPLGTKLYIESLDGSPDYGYATAEDTGGAIKGNKIDLFFDSANEVRNFGRRNVKVHILN